MRYIIFILILLCLTSCTKNYYLCYADQPIEIFLSKNLTEKIITVPTGKLVIASTKSPKCQYVKFGNNEGYCKLNSFTTKKRISSKQLKSLVFSADSIYTYANNLTQNGQSVPSSNYHTSSSSNQSSGGPVHVKGYYRKNGTYVKPYTRSAPKRH